MNIQQEIAKQVELLPPPMQEQVLRYVESLTHATPVGVRGVDMLVLAGTLDAVSSREMREAIEDGCERIDYSEW
jgi:hypothetical protein